MKAAVIAFSGRGLSLAEKLSDALSSLGWSAEYCRCPSGGLAGWAEKNFDSCDSLIFVSSVGIAVRAVSGHIKSKLTDPAVLAVDERANWVIPILSGHIGGANRLAEKLAPMIGAVAVITTATDINRLFAVDVWAKKNGFVIADPERIKAVSSKLLAGEKIRIKSDFDIEISDELSGQIELTEDANCDVEISMKQPDNEALWLIPKRLILGIGCRKNTTADKIEAAFSKLCGRLGIDERALGEAASIDIKSDERGLLSFCENHSVIPRFFSARQLNEVGGEFSHSDFVLDTVGVDNVCERAAAADGARLIEKKTACDGVTMAAAVKKDNIIVTLD